ncbi:uncharacterized protein CHSO_0917 [Chryseobacterium sp. StRB126]|nr:uncharacterized protein CHSO_0917 [Chryseobacterium sp. StRB126]
MANLKIISEEASLNRLSPSKTVDKFLGTFTNFKIAPALTASGGETIPPSTKPNANENPGIYELATKATDIAVRKTTIKAKLVMIRLNFQISFHETAKAASYNNGGKKMIKISSGSIFKGGKPGIKLISRPAITNIMG